MRELKKEKTDHITTITQLAFVVAMNSVGDFLEKEIDGKSYLIYNFSSQTHNPSSSGEAAIDSGGDNDLPLFLCPSLRIKVPELWSHTPVVLSPHFPNIKSGDKQPDYMLGSNICNLPLLPIFWCNNSKPVKDDFFCGACRSPMLGTSYYLCVTCLEKFHRECVESPLEIINHPFKPLCPLQLCCADFETCIDCQEPVNGMAYHDPTPCISYYMHPVCAMKPILFVIDHHKRHPHPLTLFPKQAHLPCNACGLIKEDILTYVCLRCTFVFHQDCLYFPYVIRISRHHHRISFTFSRPRRRFFCGVCRKILLNANKSGAYSCDKCSYFVHTRCALRRDLWDGKELEEEPEESEIVVEPFERIAEGIILHFSHGHHLKLEMSEVYDANKICQGCVLPIYEGSYYSCMDDECGFILHEDCANAPRRKISPLHPRPLSLKVVTDAYGDNKGLFRCDACARLSCGFVYEDFKGEVSCQLDLRCASVSEPFTYQGHKHPLFLALNPEEEGRASCAICRHRNFRSDYRRKLNCIECGFVICFSCATLPYKARYKHDKHFLTFCKPEEAKDRPEWCDVCEGEISRSGDERFYSCDDYCCTTIHIDCLLGKDVYLKPGRTIKYDETYHHILVTVNKTLSRPVCKECGRRCPHRVFLKDKNSAFCSLFCLEYSLRDRYEDIIF